MSVKFKLSSVLLGHTRVFSMYQEKRGVRLCIVFLAFRFFVFSSLRVLTVSATRSSERMRAIAVVAIVEHKPPVAPSEKIPDFSLQSTKIYS